MPCPPAQDTIIPRAVQWFTCTHSTTGHACITPHLSLVLTCACSTLPALPGTGHHHPPRRGVVHLAYLLLGFDLHLLNPFCPVLRHRTPSSPALWSGSLFLVSDLHLRPFPVSRRTPLFPAPWSGTPARSRPSPRRMSTTRRRRRRRSPRPLPPGGAKWSPPLAAAARRFAAASAFAAARCCRHLGLPSQQRQRAPPAAGPCGGR